MNPNFLFYGKRKATKPQESTEEAIIKYGREQIRRLVAKGLRVPVVFL